MKHTLYAPTPTVAPSTLDLEVHINQRNLDSYTIYIASAYLFRMKNYTCSYKFYLCRRTHVAYVFPFILRVRPTSPHFMCVISTEPNINTNPKMYLFTVSFFLYFYGVILQVGTLCQSISAYVPPLTVSEFRINVCFAL